MADNTGIEWTDATWNPVRGCARVSDGCRNCYAERVAGRFSGAGQPYEGLIHPSTGGWNGTVKLVPEALQVPWRWTRGRRIFVNSMSDLFHPDVPFEFIAAVFWIMSVTTRHTYQVLTKRPERMLAFFQWLADYEKDPDLDLIAECTRFVGRNQFENETIRGAMEDALYDAAHTIPEVAALPWHPSQNGRGGYDNCGPSWPYRNVWLGVSVEDQRAADERIPLLLKCPAAVRWISAEPLLGPIELRCGSFNDSRALHPTILPLLRIDWVVAGGESGPSARPMSPDWARSLRDQCSAAGVPFLFKQWGEWIPMLGQTSGVPVRETALTRDGWAMGRAGKKAAGRHLDGVLHDAYPEVHP